MRGFNYLIAGEGGEAEYKGSTEGKVECVA